MGTRPRGSASSSAKGTCPLGFPSFWGCEGGRKYFTPGGELFSLRKKRTVGIRLSAWQKAGSLYRLNHPFSALKKALKKLRVPRGFNPLGESARQRLAALTHDQSSPGTCRGSFDHGFTPLRGRGQNPGRLPPGRGLPAPEGSDPLRRQFQQTRFLPDRRARHGRR